MKLLLRDLSSRKILEFWGLFSVDTAQISSPPAKSQDWVRIAVRELETKRCVDRTELKAFGFSVVGLSPRYSFDPSQSPRWVSFFISSQVPLGAIFQTCPLKQCKQWWVRGKMDSDHLKISCPGMW